MVLAGGGASELLLLLLELDELLELVLVGGMHGWMATDSWSEPFGITSWLEPGGGLLLPLAWVTWASEQGGTASVTSLFCGGITTVRTPGLVSAVDTTSELELEELLLLPHAATPMQTAATAMSAADSLRLLRVGLPWSRRIHPPLSPAALVPTAPRVKRWAFQQMEGSAVAPARHVGVEGRRD